MSALNDNGLVYLDFAEVESLLHSDVWYKVIWRSSGDSNVALRIEVEGIGCSGARYVSDPKLASLPFNRPVWVIDQLKIERDKRGKGNGVWLLNLMRTTLWDSKRIPILLECHPYDGTPYRWLRSWYLRRGFKSISRTRYRVCKPPAV